MKTTLRIDDSVIERLYSIKIKFGFSSLEAVIIALLNNVRRFEFNIEGEYGETK